MISRYSLDIGFNDFLLALKEILNSKVNSKNIPAEFRFSINGRSALRRLLKDFGIKKNEKVVVPLITCESVHHAIIESGGIPEYVFPKENNFYPSVSDYVEIINSVKAKYVVVISSWGYPYPIEELKNKLTTDIVLIQDCALSYGSFRNDIKDGFLADAYFYSFSNGKPLFLFGGGMFSKINNETEYTTFQKRKKINDIINILQLYLKSLIINHRIILQIFYKYKKNGNSSTGMYFSNESLPWLCKLYEKKKELIHRNLLRRKKRFTYMINLFENEKICSLDIESNVKWNYWMVPIKVPDDTDLESLCNKMISEGFDVIEPYKAEIQNYKINSQINLDTQIPKLILSPSLDFMTLRLIDKFVNLLYANI